MFQKVYFPLVILFTLVFNSNIKAQGSGYTLPFDGVAGYIAVAGSGLGAITNNFTIEMWFKPTTAITVPTQQNCSNCISGTSGERYIVYPTWGGTTNIAGAGIAAGTNCILVYEHANNYLPALLVYTATISDWNHLAVVYNSKTPSLYLNGVLVATGLTSLRTSVFPSASIAGPTYGFFPGNVDEFRIWNYARSATQIRDAMCQKLTMPQGGLIRYYQFDNGSGTILTDLTGNENGTVAGMGGAPTWTLSGAPVGDASIYTYTPGTWTGQTLTLPPAGNGTTFSVTAVTGTPTGVQIYQVNGVPNSTAGIVGIGTNTVYYGTFIVNGTSPNYDATINYTNYNPLPNVKMFTRGDNSISPWIAGPSNLAPPPYLITKTANTARGEFILGTTSSVSPLPIELVEFEAVTEKDKVILNWQTASETNNAYFTLEKSKDAFNFTKLLDVKAAGKSSSLKKYSEVDWQPYNGITYYRLKQTNTDGSFNYFKIVSANKHTENKITVYPNPLQPNDNLFVKINGEKDQEVLIRITDPQGSEVFIKKIRSQENNQIITLDILKSFPTGLYFITTFSKNETLVYKLVVQ